MSNSFETHSRIWNENAKSNAQWAVLSDPNRLQTGFSKQEFYHSGIADVEGLLQKVLPLYPSIDFAGQALDFGCGVGRLSSALAQKFTSVIALDVSAEMIRQAKMNNLPNIDFRVNTNADLKSVADDSISFLLSLIVVQHIPPPFSLNYLREFARVLKPGGVLVVQIPSERYPSFKNTLRKFIPEKLFRLKHKLFRSHIPYVTMFGIQEKVVTKLFSEAGLSKIFVEADGMGGADWDSRTYIFRK